MPLTLLSRPVLLICRPLHVTQTRLISKLHSLQQSHNRDQIIHQEEVSLSFFDCGHTPDQRSVDKLLAKGIRPYFYFIDIHGQVFLQDTHPKNFTSCYKDPKFLNFFISRIKLNTLDLFPEYLWQSPCGKEVNFVEAADTPIVFHSLQNDHLLWAGNLSTPFLPDQIRVSASTGRLYHPLPDQLLARSSSNEISEKCKGSTLGLLRSSLVLSELASNLDEDSLNWKGEQFLLHKF